MTAGTALTRLRERAALGWLRERDIDLLVCSEVHVDGPLRDHLAGLWLGRRVTFDGAWVSHAEIDGESDLVVVFHDGNQTLVLLVENKIGADFQPDQVQRYAARAERWRDELNADVLTALLAPEEYIQQAVNQVFDATISYEALVAALKSGDDARSKFLADALTAGIASYRKGYVLVPDAQVSSVWGEIWRIACSTAPLLNMEAPSEKPGRSTWIYFRRASGFPDNLCVPVLKADRGQVDLQFRHMGTAELHRVVEDLIEPDMTIVKASKSASVRVNVPPIDFHRPAGEQEDQIRGALQQAERLRQFYVKNRIRDRLPGHPM